GKRQTPLQDLVWDLSKFAIILTFVSNADGYLTAAMDAIKSMKDGFLGKPVWATLDTMWSTTQLLADKVYAMDQSKYVSVEGGIGSMLVWGGSILIMSVAAVIYMLADVTMQLAILVAPIFIGCYMFGFTRVMFNNWLGILFSSVFTVIFAGVLVKIGTEFQTDMLSQISRDANSTNILTMGAMAFVIGVLIAVFVWKSSSFAQQLAG
ncbi:type IV secretion system protein, partial [Escherichia coli]|nr:type IV secretion system protein [Escherichia coli]